MEASSLYFDFGDILILFKHIHTYVRTCTYLSHWLKMTRIYQQSWLVRVLIIKLNDSFEIGSLWQSFHGKTVHPTIAQRMILIFMIEVFKWLHLSMKCLILWSRLGHFVVVSGKHRKPQSLIDTPSLIINITQTTIFTHLSVYFNCFFSFYVVFHFREFM